MTIKGVTALLLMVFLCGTPLKSIGITLDTLPTYKDTGMRFLIQGTEKIQNNDILGAISDLKQAAIMRPDMPEVFHNLGYALERIGETQKAIKAYEKALSINPGYAPALNNLGVLLANNEIDVQKAVDLCQKAVRLEPSSAQYRDSLGWAYYKAGKTDEAIKSFKEAIILDPSFFKPRFHLGVLALNSKDYNEAIRYFSEVISINPDFIRAYIPLAVCYEKSGQKSKALFIYQQALTKAGNSTSLKRFIEKEIKRLSGESKSYYFSNIKSFNSNTKLTDFLNSRKKNNHINLFGNNSNLGNQYFEFATVNQIKNKNQSVRDRYFMNADGNSEIQSGNRFKVNSYTLSTYNSKKLSNLEQQYNKRTGVGVMNIVDDNLYKSKSLGYSNQLSLEEERRLERKYSIAKSYLDRGLINEAETELKEIISKSPDSTVGRQAKTLLLKVIKLLDQKKLETAQKHLEMAKDFFRAGKYDLAEEQYKKVLENNPENAIAYKDLALLHYNQGKYKQAYEECKKAIALDKTLKESYVILGSLYAKKGRIEEAIRVLKKVKEVSLVRDSVDELAENMLRTLESES